MPVYRCRGVALLVPLYGGLIAGRIDTWSLHNGNVVSRAVGYSYDSAGRIVREHGPVENIAYTHDSRGNITRISGGLMADSVYTYSGDRLTSFAQAGETSAAFSYDNHGRMTSDGLKGTSFQYNTMDLVAKICSGATTLVNYSYLWNGVKICALKTSGDGLVYRGPFVYRKSSDGNVILESALFEDGRLTTSGVILHVTDHLGSVVAAVRGSDGALYEASQYDAFGKRSSLTEADTVPLPEGIVLRSGFSGKEDQKPEFGAEYMDFGARQYSSMQRRWMTPDPLSEKYYGISPYTYCDGDPVNFIDPDGRWDILIEASQDREKFPYALMTVTDRNNNVIYRTVVMVKGNGRERNVTNGDTPQGRYKLIEWRTPGLDEEHPIESFGPNPYIATHYEEGEGGTRDGMHIHGGREQTDDHLIPTNGCIRIADEDIKELKEVTDMLTALDPGDTMGRMIVDNNLKTPIFFLDRKKIKYRWTYIEQLEEAVIIGSRKELPSLGFPQATYEDKSSIIK